MMDVLLLGGTGTIGSAILGALVDRGHRVLALARSDASADWVSKHGATALPGNIHTPEQWVPALPEVGAVIHAACDFGDMMGAVDQHLLDILLPKLGSQTRKPRFIYTGGCWLFGETGPEGETGPAPTTEETPFAPLPAFAWMVAHLRRVLDSPLVDGIVIHPAMVYDVCGGVFTRFAHEAVERGTIRVVGSEAVHWPLVHRDDLAQLYVLALERAAPRSSYLGVALDGIPVGQIARAFAERFGTHQRAPDVISTDAIARELGDWARGYGYDQRQSGAKARGDLGWTPHHNDPSRLFASILNRTPEKP